jgi:FkbM family methyltransferase
LISYTRNFEDVILQRVFGGVQQGVFIDVGASVPVDDSNTYALYEKGWRGIAIEPLGYERYWQQARPEDKFLNVAAGAQPGTTTLYIFDQAQQISSCSVDTVSHWEKGNYKPTRTREIQIVTLNDVIGAYLSGKTIHLVSIDVEGFEAEVLKGIDLSLHRPWVILVEATLPGVRIEAHQQWEPILLSAGYTMVYFDGVNRFFLANERDDLRGHFRYPPNVWDSFTPKRQIDLERRVAELEAQVAALSASSTSKA